MQHMNLPVGFSGGLVTWRLRALHLVAKALGLLVKVEGFPYGSSRNLGDREPVTYPYIERVAGDDALHARNQVYDQASGQQLGFNDLNDRNQMFVANERHPDVGNLLGPNEALARRRA